MSTLLDMGNALDFQRWAFRHSCRDCACQIPSADWVEEDAMREGKPYKRMRCNKCHTTTGWLSGTPWAYSKLQPRAIYSIIFLFCQKVPMCTIAKIADVSDEGVKGIIEKVMQLIVAHNYLEFATTEVDDDQHVQVDETAVGARKYNRGARRRKNGVVWVAGMVIVEKVEQCKVMKMIARVVETRKKEDLQPLINKVIKEDTTVVSDKWRAYIGINGNHQTVNHSVEFVNSEGWHTNACEGMWRCVKTEVKARWSRVGTEDLDTVNARVQCGIFFANHGLEGKNPFRTILNLASRWEDYEEVLRKAREDQEASTPQEQLPRAPSPRHIVSPSQTDVTTRETARAFFADRRRPTVIRERAEATTEPHPMKAKHRTHGVVTVYPVSARKVRIVTSTGQEFVVFKGTLGFHE